jgi:hypothetical protein
MVMDLKQAVVVVPAHNEVANLRRCLRALTTAAACVPMPAVVVVVLDACDDGSDGYAGQFGPDVQFLSIDAGNVGAARAAGFEYSKTLCSGVEPTHTWYATTDADSVVGADWLLKMTASEADMVLGVVRIPVWRHFPAEVARRYLRAYHRKKQLHNHIHGANMGFRADAYWRVGGFRALPTGEDVELVERFEAGGSEYCPGRDLVGGDVGPSERSRSRWLRPPPARADTQDGCADVTTALVRKWLASGALELPLPAGGATLLRWLRLAELTETDVVAGRLSEAHTDAIAILAELTGPEPETGQLWGVWAAESPDAVVYARGSGDAVTLDGAKAWCSGAGLCSHALVTARVESGERGLFAVPLDQPEVRPLPSNWRNAGMAESDTRSVQFSGAAALPVGKPGEYLSRPGFWHGAIGVSACWLGGVRAVATPLYERAADRDVDAHTLAHLGAVDAAVFAAETCLMAAAAEVDADPLNRKGRAEVTARRTRAVVETAVDEAINRTARALGPAPLCQDARHAQRVADLTIYVRQSDAERDLERLGRLAGTR